MDWIRLFEDHNIPYVTRGPNVTKNNVGIQCPWCGDDDPSEHLNVSLMKEAYGCWRSSGHGGHQPYRLIQALLGGSYGQAKLVAAQYSAPDPSTLDQALAALTGTSEAPKPVAGDEAPMSSHLLEFRDFHRIRGKRSTPTRWGGSKKYWEYLKGRGFSPVSGLCDEYDLRYTTTGQWKDRVIIPLYQQHELIGWTARALVKPHVAPRYLSSSNAVKSTIFNEDELRAYEGHLLFITEGPFDAMKLDFYGKTCGVRATCGFGVSLNIGQICLLRSLAGNFKRSAIVFDRGTTEASMKISEWLGTQAVTIPPYVKDPGEMTADQVHKFIFDCLNPR